MMRLAVLSLLAAPLAVLGTAGPARGAELCQGQLPTIVGAPGETVAGTAGDDVITTGGATEVDAMAGNDRICVTLDAYTVRVVAGLGDDVVDSTQGQSTVHAFLGDGADTFVGGDQRDHVYARGAEAPVDTIATGGGSDVASVGRSGLPVSDVVDMGPGADTLDLAGLPGPGTVSLGTGRDSIQLLDRSGAAWAIDNQRQEVVAEGRAMTLTGARDFYVGEARWASLSFVGGAGRDQLFTADPYGRQHAGANQGSLVVADMAGGDDVLGVRADQADVLHGGDGDDRIMIGALESDGILDGSVHADLRDGTVRFDGDRTAKVTSFSNVGITGYDRFMVRLGDGADILTLVGCRAVVRAGGGSDRVHLYPSRFLVADATCRGKVSAQALRAYGEGGDDTLRGAAGNDVLVGGAGVDKASGASGVDLCSAETRRACERP